MNKGLLTVCPNWLPFNEGVIVQKNTTYIFKAKVARYSAKIGDKYVRVLSTGELNKASRFVNKLDSDRYISGRFLLRHVLSLLFGTSPERVQLRYTKYQKPYSEGVEFNLSHSGNYVVLALSHFAVGVDIEIIREDIDYTSLSTAIFNLEELQFLEDNQHSLSDFFTIWTRKEAILKASGEGLVDDMKDVSCLGHISIRNGRMLELVSFSIERDYIASIAINNINNNELVYVDVK